MNDLKPTPTTGSEPDVATAEVRGYRSSVSPALETAAGWAWRIIVVAIVLIGVGWVAYKLSLLFIAVMVALLIAVVLEPVTSWLCKRWN